MFTALTRVIKAGVVSFWRNMAVSTATISVMTLTLFLITAIILLVFLGSELVKDLESKIDLTVFFNVETQDEQIQKIKRGLESRDDVSSVLYVNREEALQQFRSEHADDTLIQETLAELGDNPLRAYISIKARKLSDFEAIGAFMRQDQYTPYISKILDDNSQENRRAVAKLQSFTTGVRKVGLTLGLIFVLVAVLVSFNTIRLTIINARGSIRIMRLIGSASFFIRGPFVVMGIMYGVIAAIITMAIYLLALQAIAPRMNDYIGASFDVFHLYADNGWAFLLIQLVLGVLLGGVSSFIAVRRYLNV